MAILLLVVFVIGLFCVLIFLSSRSQSLNDSSTNPRQPKINQSQRDISTTERNQANQEKMDLMTREKESEVYFEKAVIALHTGRFKESIFFSTKAIELNPKMIEAWNTRASAFQMNGQIQEAISSYIGGLKIDSRDEVIRENLLGILFAGVFNNTREGEMLFNRLSEEEKRIIENLVNRL